MILKNPPAALAIVIAALLCFVAVAPVAPNPAAPVAPNNEELARLRNLGKALYENPTTSAQAVEIFHEALAMAPDSPRERVNHGLALLRSGKEQQGIAELQKAQRQDPSIPHTWFNLGIAFKKDGQYELALSQFQQMIRLVPDEPVSHYNLGYLYKVTGKPDLALAEFEIAERLDPNLAGSHFQIYNAKRAAGRDADAAREWQLFQEIKKRQAGAAVPEDLDWSFYAEIYETGEPCPGKSADQPADSKFENVRVASGFDPATAGLVVLDAGGNGHSDLLGWSKNGVQLLKDGTTPAENTGLEDLKNVVSISPGDFNNDGLPDLCVITKSDVWLYVNHGEPSRSLLAR